MKNFAFWKDVPVTITTKVTHIRKIGGKTYKSFINDFGEIPIGVLNCVTKELMPVINTRGMAYATRNRLRFRKNKKKNSFI